MTTILGKRSQDSLAEMKCWLVGYHRRSLAIVNRLWEGHERRHGNRIRQRLKLARYIAYVLAHAGVVHDMLGSAVNNSGGWILGCSGR